MGGEAKNGNKVFDVVRLISLPKGGSSSPLSTDAACDSRGFSRRCTRFYCDFILFFSFGDFKHEKLCLWLVFYVVVFQKKIVKVEQMAKASRRDRRKVITR